MKMIVAVDLNWGIGKEGNLLDHIPEDMAFFKEKTINNAVIMGKNTFMSFPSQKPLVDRMNIVLTKDPDFVAEGVIVCHSIEEAMSVAKEKFSDENIYFIGGEQIYKQCEKYCDVAYVTKIDKEYEADRFFPNLDENDNWSIKNEEMLKTKKGIYITFTTYVKE